MPEFNQHASDHQWRGDGSLKPQVFVYGLSQHHYLLLELETEGGLKTEQYQKAGVKVKSEPKVEIEVDSKSEVKLDAELQVVREAKTNWDWVALKSVFGVVQA